MPWDLFDDAGRAEALATGHSCARALLNLTTWKMWDLQTGKPAKDALTEEAQAVLEEALENQPATWQHAGLLHLYVHLMEMSPFPEKALKMF